MFIRNIIELLRIIMNQIYSETQDWTKKMSKNKCVVDWILKKKVSPEWIMMISFVNILPEYIWVMIILNDSIKDKER